MNKPTAPQNTADKNACGTCRSLTADRDAARAELGVVRQEVEEWRAAYGESALRNARQVLAERDGLFDRVKRVRDRHPRKTDSTDCTDGDTALGCQHDLGYHTVEYCGLCHEPWPCAEIRNLDGTEAG